MEFGLINKVVPFNKLKDKVVNWFKTMMKHSQQALRMIKMSLNVELDGQAGIRKLTDKATLLYYCIEESQEDKKAFLEKCGLDFSKFPKFLKSSFL